MQKLIALWCYCCILGLIKSMADGGYADEKSLPIRFEEQSQIDDRDYLENMDATNSFDNETFNELAAGNTKNLERQQASSGEQRVTNINIGAQSRLLTAPGTTVQIYFEVTNLRSTPSIHNFRVTDEQRYLRQLTPQTSLINPGQTISVVVTAYVPEGVEVGVRDKITLTSQGITLASQSAYLTVTSAAGMQDNSQPSLWYTYGARCEGKSSSGNCAGSFWNLEITAQDYETGLLRIQSIPAGIYYRTTFTAGTRESVSATFTASCCQPKVTITAIDLAGNQRVEAFDVTNIWLNEAGIAAVVLGVLLLIILIVLLVFCICWCIKKRRSQELPVYRTERVS